MLASDIIDSHLASRSKFTKALFERPDSFAKLLPYHEFLKESGLFVLRDGSLGAIFEIELIEHEVLDAAKIVEKVELLKSLFSLPPKCALQILFDQELIPPREKVWFADPYPNAHPISKELFKARIATLRAFAERKSDLAPMRRRALLSIRYFPEKGRSKAILNIMERGERLLFNTMNELCEEISEFSQVIAQYLDNSALKLKRVDGARLVDMLRRFFNPKEYLAREFAPYNEAISPSDQVIYASPTGSLEGLEREGVKTRTITLKTSPRRVFPGGTASFLTLPFPYRLSMNFSFPDAKKVKGYFDVKEFFLENSPSARARRQRDELKEIQTRLAHDEKCLFMTFSVIVEGETEEVLNQRTRAVLSVFHEHLECEVIKEELIGLGLLLNSLPLFYTPASDHASQRFIRILNRDATKLLPVFDSYRGQGKGSQVFLSRENNLVFRSWRSNSICNHSVFLADTGSGKSKAILDCLQSMKREDPKSLIFVLDKRASCEELCRIYDGELASFDKKKGLPFSAFRGVFDDERIAFLTNLLLAGIRLTSTSFEAESQHTTILARAIKDAYLRKVAEANVVYEKGTLKRAGSEFEICVSMDDVIPAMAALTANEEFEALREMIENLISRLSPFYGDGIYAPYFRAEKAKKRKEKATTLFAYDLEALDEDETLKVLMSLSIFFEIGRKMKDAAEQRIGGAFVFEELGCLGRDNPIVGKYATEFAERMRKLGFDLIAAGPNPGVFFTTEAGRAVWSAAKQFFFMKMTPDNVLELTKNSRLLSRTAAEIVRSLETKDGAYAEVFVTTADGSHQGAFRFIQSKLDRQTTANSAKDREALKHE